MKFTNNPGQVLSHEEHNDSRGNHEEAVVEQQTILTQVFSVQLLLDNYSITGCEQIIQEDKRVTEQYSTEIQVLRKKVSPFHAKSQVVDSGHYGAQYHQEYRGTD